MNDGTFGVTAECEPFEDELVQRIETHRYDPVRVLQWRNGNLDFRSRFGYVPEEPHLYAHLSALEYLVMVGQLRNLPAQSTAERIEGLLPKELHDDSRAFLTEMRDVHIRNVARCDELLVALDGAAK